jgi:RimJ/RimL family protein N-acetyltransferase
MPIPPNDWELWESVSSVSNQEYEFPRNRVMTPILDGKDLSRNEDPLFILETKRLLLRRQQLDDVSFLVDLWSDPIVTRYVGGPRKREWLQLAFEDTAQNPFAKEYDLWVTIEKASGQRLGHCGLINKEVEGKLEYDLGYFFDSSTWGIGYATEIGRALLQHAREDLGLRRLIALIDPLNTASQNVALKLGMKLEREIIRPRDAPRRVYAIEFGSYQRQA